MTESTGHKMGARREHELKVWPRFFDVLLSGEKTFEIRKDDRWFQAGDTLLLREWVPDSTGTYTGREMRREVTYLMAGPSFGIVQGYVVMALAPETQKSLTTLEGGQG